MSPQEIAETLINGNISDARRAIVSGKTQTEAAVCALEVLAELWYHDDETASPEADLYRLLKCLRGRP